MSEKSIGSMSRQELVDLVGEIYDKSDAMKLRYAEIDRKQTEFEHGLFLEKIQQALDKSIAASKEINTMKIDLQDSNKKIKESAVEDFNKYRETHQELYTRYERVYAELYKNKEGELLSELTTVSLSKEFGDKVKEHEKSRRIWQGWLIFILIVAISESFYSYSIPSSLGYEWLLWNFLTHLPIYGFFVWLVIFIGNRRAENAKLEEIYKHKEAMAKTFFGYKKSIEALTGDDKNLLINHMKNLLEAIKKDPSNILSSKGERHPATEIIGKGKSPSSN